MALPSRDEIDSTLLSVLAEVGRARLRDVYPRVTQRFPDITPRDLSATRSDGRYVWQNQIQWSRNRLADRGWLDRTEQRGWWALTGSGLMEARRREGDAPSPPTLPPVPPEPDAALPDEEDGSRPITLAVVPGETERIVAALVDASRDSARPSRLEHAVGEALAFLGFDVEVIGGPGKTDVLAVAPLGSAGYRVVLDAKSTASGPVADAQIDWVSIRDHREQERADYACVVGPAFAGGQIRTRAAEFDTSLLTAGDLAGVVEIHADTPVTLAELRALFESAPNAGAGIPQVRRASGERGRRQRLLLRLLEQIEMLNSFRPDLALTVDVLFAALFDPRDPDMREATLDDTAHALSMLRAAGVLASTNDGGYLPQTSRRGALQMLRAFGHAPDERDGDGTPETSRSTANGEQCA